VKTWSKHENIGVFDREGGYTLNPCLDKEKARFSAETQKQRIIAIISDIFENIALSAPLEEVRQAPRGGGWRPFWTPFGRRIGPNRGLAGVKVGHNRV